MIVAAVSGAEPVARGLDTVAAQLGDLQTPLEQLGEAMTDAAEPLTPVASGALVDSLTASAGADGLTFGSDLVYAGVQSYGWPGRGIEASGFAQAAEALAEDEGAGIIEDHLTELARRVGL